MQQSIQGQAVASPMVQMQFASDIIASGPLAVGLDQNSQASIMVMDVLPGNNACLAAIAVGTIQVTGAQDTTTTDGGTLSLTGSNLTLYHPTDTPYGDISSELPSEITVCGWE
ncbi:MAG: hypothetical protein ACOC1F_08300 [Myxococcota bacterium]